MARKSVKKLFVVVAAVLAAAFVCTFLFFMVPVMRITRSLNDRPEATEAVQTVTASQSTLCPNEENESTVTSEKPTGEMSEESTTKLPDESHLTDFDIYRSGNFYATGYVTDENGEKVPMEIALTDSTVYMTTVVSGINLGVMISDGKTYLVSPAKETYLEMSNTVMSVLGINVDDLKMSAGMSFSGIRPLEKADDVNDVERNGIKCREYTFEESNGKKSIVYMDGDRLVETVVVNSDGIETSRMFFETISADVPREKTSPPTSYKKVSVFKFIKLFSEDILQ